ncbi:MAG: protein kinase [Candidatus Sumerlaeia bacterium]|nr:protein kinase [Candidatus Sumerlaeia bacterium]
MLHVLKNWLTPLSAPRAETVLHPAHLPDNPRATLNPTIHAGATSGDFARMTLPSVARWKVHRADEDPGETTPFLVSRDGMPALPDADGYAAGYKLRHVIARGGFGEIWEATQEVLSRTVAVKRLREDLLEKHREEPEMLLRLETGFRQEALVAAYLEHPNILPVHDLGVDGSGHLLLATKLVRGLAWDILLNVDKELPREAFLEKHLAILEQVSQAVAFAHRRGVIHRDLKPPQVMVGEFGEVLLMDWGIAMFTMEGLPEGVEPALRGVVAPSRLNASNPAGTVVYMAPEQTEQSVRNIGPWTDIYLLGGILYELLTGRTPHEGESKHQSFFLASLGQVAPPWEVAPALNVPPQLSELAMDCLEPIPAKRLASVEEFIRRLNEFREGASRRREARTLLAQVSLEGPEPADYGPVARDQSLVARAMALWPGNRDAEAAYEALTLRHARLALRNRDLKLARIEATRLPAAHPERAALLAEVDRLEDEQARARERLDAAYARLRASHSRAERLVGFLLDDLHTSLKEVNRLDIMGKVGREALEYFDSLSAEEEQTPDAMAKRAAASRNIGDVFRDQGRLEDADAAFRAFHELAARLLEGEPGSAEAHARLASALERLSGIDYLRGRLDDALARLEEGLRLAGRLGELRRPTDADAFLQGKLAHQRGIVLWRRRRLEEALAAQLDSLARFESLAAAFPESVEYRQALGWNLSTLGNVHRDLGDLPEAIRRTEQSLATRAALCAADPDNKPLIDDECWTLTNLSLLREYSGDFEGALVSFAGAERLRRRLVEEDPSNAAHRNKLAFIVSSRARNLYGLERYAEAAAASAEATDITRRTSSADPGNIQELGSHALNLGYHGLALYYSGHVDEARATLAEAQPAARRAHATVPENGVYQNAVCQSLLLEGHLATRDGDAHRARACWDEARRILAKQSWRTATGQGVGMHFELSVFLGDHEAARDDARTLRERRWMMPRWERMLAGLA